jgi:hypothetical protein
MRPCGPIEVEVEVVDECLPDLSSSTPTTSTSFSSSCFSQYLFLWPPIPLLWDVCLVGQWPGGSKLGSIAYG